MKPDDIEEFIKNNKHKSIHELITNRCKLIFDIDMDNDELNN